MISDLFYQLFTIIYYLFIIIYLQYHVNCFHGTENTQRTNKKRSRIKILNTKWHAILQNQFGRLSDQLSKRRSWQRISDDQPVTNTVHNTAATVLLSVHHLSSPSSDVPPSWPDFICHCVWCMSPHLHNMFFNGPEPRSVQMLFNK